MKLLTSLILLVSVCGAARKEFVPRPRATTSTCSIGIGRVAGSPEWDLTVYNVAQAAQRQDWNILTTMKAQVMGKGESITVPASENVAQEIKITNVDDAPAFDYSLSVQSDGFVARWEDPSFGDTKTRLDFSIPDAGYNWTTEACGAVNIITTGGREGWTCDFPCTATSSRKEL